MKTHHVMIIGLVLLLFGCSDQGVSVTPVGSIDLPLTSAINGTPVVCPLNQSFSLELDLNADAGYQWDHTISDTTILRLDSTHYRPKNGDWSTVGGLTVETFWFRATGTGQCTVELIQHRAWESDIRPIQTVRFSVVVHPR